MKEHFQLFIAEVHTNQKTHKNMNVQFWGANFDGFI